MALPTSYNTDLLASTVNKWMLENGVIDNIFKANALFFMLHETRELRDGGNSIVVPLEYAENTSRGSYSGYDPLDVTPREVFTAAEFAWKQAYASISISGEEDLKNSGDSAKYPLLENRVRNAEMSMQAELDTQLYTDGTGNSSKDMVGLALAIDYAGTYAGINRSAETWWSAKETAAGGVLTEAMLQGLYNDCSLGRIGGSPQVGLTTQIIFEAYEDLLTPEKRYSNSDLATAGFENLKYKGASIAWDQGATTQILWFVNTKFMKFISHSQRDFVATPMKQPTNQDANVMQLLWMGALASSNSRKHGKLTGITNT